MQSPTPSENIQPSVDQPAEEELPQYAEERVRISAHRSPDSGLAHHASREWLRRQAFEIGWDFAQYGLRPEGKHENVWEGHRAGVVHFGVAGSIKHDLFIRKWLRLRSSANRRGRIFDSSVTPDLIRKLAVKYCPVTRQEILYPDHLCGESPGSFGDDNIWTVDRLNNEAGYIEGNVIVMSQLANFAKERFGFDESREMAIAAEKERDGKLRGLTSAQWGRVASLCLLVDSRPAVEEVAHFPMLCMVPAGIHVLHFPLVVQFQMMRAVGTSAKDGGKAASQWVSIFPNKKTRALASDMVKTLGYWFYAAGKSKKWDGNPLWELEDVWLQPAVWTAWKKLMRHLTMDELRSAARATKIAETDIGNWSRRAGIGSLGYSCEEDGGPMDFMPQVKIAA